MSQKTSVYKKKIIKQLYFSRNLSCSELSLAINKSLPLTTRIVNELIAENIVIEIGHAASPWGWGSCSRNTASWSDRAFWNAGRASPRFT